MKNSKQLERSYQEKREKKKMMATPFCQKKKKREGFKTSPKNAWEIIFKLIEGFPGDRRSYNQKTSKINKER